MISQFVSITRLRSRNNAGCVLQEQGWDLDKAISWLYEHKDDDEYKKVLVTELEMINEKPGSFLFNSLHNLTLKLVFTSSK